jgi:hypothetical protein
MALTNAEKQKRWRDKRNALARANPEAIEHALLQDAERAERGELLDPERKLLADRLADRAMHHLRRSQEFARLARRIRAGRDD